VVVWLYVPSTIALATNLGVDDVQSRLAGKILQILYIEVRPSPIPDARYKERAKTKPLMVQDLVYLGLTGCRENPRVGVSNLPAGLDRKVCYPHPVRSATRTWGNTLVGREILVAAGSACKLDNQAFAHEVRAIYTVRCMFGQMNASLEVVTYGKL
jgi:hypothetical protein